MGGEDEVSVLKEEKNTKALLFSDVIPDISGRSAPVCRETRAVVR